MSSTTPASATTGWTPPHPGSQEMPRWSAGELVEAPAFRLRNWAALIGPGIVAGGAAIGGGEWLVGPEVTARYGGTVMWLATLSILGQVLYNIEISRYTLYCGEPIFTGKFRCLPGPAFWCVAYLFLDFGSVFPYLAANAATPVATIWLGHVPNPDVSASDWWLMKGLALVIFLGGMLPLFVGGKIYNSLKVVMTFKIFAVLSFLLVLTLGYARAGTWWEVCSGFVKFGNVPVRAGEDRNGNGQLDPGEDWDRDGRLDVVEERLAASIDSDGDGKADAWADLNGDGKGDKFRDVDGDGRCDGDNSENIFVSLWEGRGVPAIDLSLIASLCALAAIAGQGGLSNTPISNYTRDQGWGMGWHVGAIPSLFGGHHVKLSHEGCVFPVNATTLSRWRGWYRHVARDQLAVWMPACFIGLALPSMLSVEFLPRGTEASQWTAAAMTAGGVRDRVAAVSGVEWGSAFWGLTLLCGFLALGPTVTTNADGIVRRWVDAFWTANPRLRQLPPQAIRRVYFLVLLWWTVLGVVMLWFKPMQLVHISTQILNFALGISCWHTLALNCTLLPRELRPNWAVRVGLVLFGIFFTALTTVTTLKQLGYFG